MEDVSRTIDIAEDTVDFSRFEAKKGDLVIRPDKLKIPADIKKGPKVLEGRAYLLNLPDLEGKLCWIPLDMVYPNPDQPRNFFDEEKMVELRVTIGARGQSNPIHVNPIVFKKVGNAGFMIIDGERRWRVLTEMGVTHIKAIVKSLPTPDDIHEESLILNVSKEDHTPIELAYAYDKMAKRLTSKGLGKSDAIEAAAKKLGRTKIEIKNHIRLLELSKETQQLIATKQLPTRQSLQLAAVKKKFGDRIDDLKAARLIIDNPGKQFEVANRGTAVGELTRKGVRDAIQASLVDKGSVSQAEMVRLQSAATLHDVLQAMSNVKRVMRPIQDPKIAAALVDLLRSERRQGHPPERVQESVQETLDALRLFFSEVVKKAIALEPLVIPKDAPPFARQVGNYRKRFPNEQRHQIALALGQASDNEGEALTADMIVEKLKAVKIEVEVGTIGQYIKRIQEEDLKGSYLEVEEHQVRRRVPRTDAKTKSGTEMKIFTAWRLAWTKKYIADMKSDGSRRR